MPATPTDWIRDTEGPEPASDGTTLPPEQIAIVDERLANHQRNPGSSLTLEQIEARLRRRFPQ